MLKSIQSLTVEMNEGCKMVFANIHLSFMRINLPLGRGLEHADFSILPSLDRYKKRSFKGNILFFVCVYVCVIMIYWAYFLLNITF